MWESSPRKPLRPPAQRLGVTKLNHLGHESMLAGSEPPCSDEFWRGGCVGLRRFLATPRNWDELTIWARDHGVPGHRLRNMLAWLEREGSATAFPARCRLYAGGSRPITLWQSFDP